MALVKKISSGSPLIGNPITLYCQAEYITDATGTLSYHKLKLKVYAALTTDLDYAEYDMSTPTESGEYHTIDISSALRAAADKYTYTPDAVTYPMVRWRAEVWDEYMLNGEVYENVKKDYFPALDSSQKYQYYDCLMGSYSDLERLLASSEFKTAQKFCRKPTTSPQIVAVGESFAYTPDFDDAVQIGSVTTGPTSKVVDITTEGSQTINGRTVYALPSANNNDDRYQFRFINGLGVLDSFSCYALGQNTMSVESTEYEIAITQTFGSPSHAIYHKQGDYENLALTSGPLDKDWLDWFFHEFLMAENCWMYLKAPKKWVRCHIKVSDTVKGMSRAKTDVTSIDFTVVLDIAGSINSALAI